MTLVHQSLDNFANSVEGVGEAPKGYDKRFLFGYLVLPTAKVILV